jgi:hypothetical protein
MGPNRKKAGWGRVGTGGENRHGVRVSNINMKLNNPM